MKTEYLIPKPTRPLSLRLSFTLLGIGLVVLGMAAYFAFGQIMTKPQAFFAALLIELSVIVEAISFVRKNNFWAIVGLVGYLAVSGTYNYIQADLAGQDSGIANSWQLFALAFGPLWAITSLALQTGGQVKAYEDKVEKWHYDRLRYIEAERKRQERRADKKEKQQNENMKVHETFRKKNESFSKVPTWRHLSNGQKIEVSNMTIHQIRDKYGVTYETARNWTRQDVSDIRSLPPFQNKGNGRAIEKGGG